MTGLATGGTRLNSPTAVCSDLFRGGAKKYQDVIVAIMAGSAELRLPE
jgi:hypothetical protein